jgi:hypothetical protein
MAINNNSSSNVERFDGNADEVEFIDLENYRNDDANIYSHQLLVMKVMTELIKNGCVELKEGFMNGKGMWCEDTRERYLQTVKTALTIMARDFDEDAERIIPQLLSDMKERKQQFLDDQWRWFNSLKPEPKKMYASKISRLFLCRDLDWFNAYREFEMEIYREIETELHKLTKRLRDYKALELIG